MTYLSILPPNTIFCVKKHKCRTTWLENRCITYASAEGASKIFFNMLIGQ